MHDRVYERLHPGDPVEATLRSRFDRYVFTMSPQVQRIGVIAQSPLLLQIQDLQGNVLASGQPALLQRLGYVTVVDLPGLAVGTDYLFEITRPDIQADRDPASLPEVAYTLGWASSMPTDSGNLVLNGDADDGNQQIGNGQVVALRFWSAPGSNLTVVGYGSQGFPSYNDLVPPAPGHAFFAGGPDNAASSAAQLIDLTGQWVAWLPAIDAGNVTFRLSAYLGGAAGENDTAAVDVTFLDANGDPLGPAVTVGPVSLAERGGLAGVVPRQGDGLVPVGTREIFVEIRMTRVDGTYDDGYADAIELHLLDYAQ